MDNIVDAVLYTGVVAGDGTITFIGEDQGLYEGTQAVAANDLTRLVLDDGQDQAYAYQDISFSEDLNLFTLEVPLAYYAPGVTPGGSDYRDVTLRLTYNATTEEFTEGFYATDEFGTVSEFVADPTGLIVPWMLTWRPDGTNEWVQTSDVGLWADLPNLLYDFEKLPAGTHAVRRVVRVRLRRQLRLRLRGVCGPRRRGRLGFLRQHRLRLPGLLPGRLVRLGLADGRPRVRLLRPGVHGRADRGRRPSTRRRSPSRCTTPPPSPRPWTSSTPTRSSSRTPPSPGGPPLGTSPARGEWGFRAYVVPLEGGLTMVLAAWGDVNDALQARADRVATLSGLRRLRPPGRTVTIGRRRRAWFNGRTRASQA